MNSELVRIRQSELLRDAETARLGRMIRAGRPFPATRQGRPRMPTSRT